jgi:hypothetical protein
LFLLLVLLVAVFAATSTRHAESPAGTAVAADRPQLDAAKPSPTADPARRVDATSPAASQATGTAARPGEAGMIVGIDPETGQIGLPTAEQRQALDEEASRQPNLSRSTVGLVEERLPNGTVRVSLDGRFQEYATVRIGPDGKKIYGCVDDPSGLLSEPVPAQPPAAEER